MLIWSTSQIFLPTFQWHKKRKRRACGQCQACQCRRDCGTCDFCVDKPKFGGSNKKRQKCRLRQCQRQAMVSSSLRDVRKSSSRVLFFSVCFVSCFLLFFCSCWNFLCCNWQRHLLPFQMAQSELAAEDAQLLGRPKPQYTYSRKSGLKKKKRLSSSVDLSDNEHNDFQEVRSQSIRSTPLLHKVLFLLQIQHPLYASITFFWTF